MSRDVDVSREQLRNMARLSGLEALAPGRYSALFALEMCLLESYRGVNPLQIVDEIRYLEDPSKPSMTKPAARFRHPPLRGLWHKHYFSARFIPQNIANHLAGPRLRGVVEEVLDPRKSPLETEEMVRELAHRVSIEPFEQRASANALTGEWIVFAKHKEENYYLSLATHTAGDKQIREKIEKHCIRQFPFLSEILI